MVMINNHVINKIIHQEKKEYPVWKYLAMFPGVQTILPILQSLSVRISNTKTDMHGGIWIAIPACGWPKI